MGEGDAIWRATSEILNVNLHMHVRRDVASEIEMMNKVRVYMYGVLCTARVFVNAKMELTRDDF